MICYYSVFPAIKREETPGSLRRQRGLTDWATDAPDLVISCPTKNECCVRLLQNRDCLASKWVLIANTLPVATALPLANLLRSLDVVRNIPAHVGTLYSDGVMPTWIFLYWDYLLCGMIFKLRFRENCITRITCTLHERNGRAINGRKHRRNNLPHRLK